MTCEFDFVLAAVRRFFRPESPLPSTEGLDWKLVVELAEGHAVSGFVRRVCDVPGLEADGAEAARANLALSAELVKLAGVFDEEQIGVIPLKGPVLATALYKEDVLKKSTDLDLLVRRRDALRAKRALEGIGYQLMTVPHWPLDNAYLRNVNDELSFRDPRSWLKLDLHWNLLPGYFPSPLDEDEVWAGTRSILWGKARLQTLSPEQQLLFLCAHGAKHLWARLGWLCDLARLVQVEQQIDWTAVFEQGRRSHTTRMTLLGLLLANDLFGVQLPGANAERVKSDSDSSVRALAATVVAQLSSSKQPSQLAFGALCTRALDRPAQRLRLLLGMFVQPTEAEYQVLQLPRPLYWTYYGFRPLRLAVKYARRRNVARDERALQAKKV
jgi:hypothetical protein